MCPAEIPKSVKHPEATEGNVLAAATRRMSMMGADVPTERSTEVRVRLGVPICLPMCVPICVVGLLGLVSPAAAQLPDRRATLAAAKSAKCDFTLYALGLVNVSAA